MRRWWWGLFLVLLLAGCTGTFEPETPVVLVAAEGRTLAFYDAGALNRGEPARIGTWDLQGDVWDLAYAGGRLFALTRDRLWRFDVGEVRLDALPARDAAKTGGWPLACADGGYLRPGERSLLVVCNDAAWRLEAFDADAASPVDLTPYPGWLALALVYDDREARDRLLVLEPAGAGVELFLEEGPRIPLLGVEDVSQGWLYRDASSGRVAVGLGLGLGSRGVLFAWRPGEEEARRLGAGEISPKGVYAAYDDALLLGEEGVLWVGEKTETLSVFRVRAAWLHPDLYLYLATPGGLSLYDAAGEEPVFLRRVGGVSAGALSGFPLR